MDRVRVRTVPLAHGGSCAGPSHVNGAKHEHGDDAGIYRSSAFFIQHTPTQHEFLFFGDVEADPDPDPVPIPLTPLPSSHPSPTPTLTPASTLDTLPISTLDTLPTSPQCTRPLLHPIWQHTAHLFTSSHLHTILLECSWPAGHPTARLFGHLGVEQVRKEMRALATEVVKARRRQNLESVKPEITPIPDLKPPLTRSTRRTPITSPPPITRGLKRKATHLTPIPPPPSTDPLSGALKGLRVIVIHCKEPPPGFDLQNAPSIADYIVRQLTKGVPELGIGPNELGVEYVAAHQGDEFVL
ncbi:3',5'-cyclic-nucleotide phosphodiesterase pde1 [Ceratobasidium sp. 392]|nr:3',5'-cyclic-nucleotide phosphodiesterase pde1 [Ceratobasidium sp. 392]